MDRKLWSSIAFEDAANQALELLVELEKLNINLDFIDMGGGLGVNYVGEETVQPVELIQCYEKLFFWEERKTST